MEGWSNEWSWYVFSSTFHFLQLHLTSSLFLSFSSSNSTGKMRYLNGDIYEGQFKDGLRSGQGVMRTANGMKYEGEWKEDKVYHSFGGNTEN